jgi:hypothetical protein
VTDSVISVTVNRARLKSCRKSPKLAASSDAADEHNEVGTLASKETVRAMKESVRSVPPEDKKVGAFDGKENDAAEVISAVMSSTPSLDKWVEVEGSKEQNDSSEKECESIGGEIIFESRADDETGGLVCVARKPTMTRKLLVSLQVHFRGIQRATRLF